MEHAIVSKKQEIEDKTPGFQELEGRFEKRTEDYNQMKKSIAGMWNCSHYYRPWFAWIRYRLRDQYMLCVISVLSLTKNILAYPVKYLPVCCLCVLPLTSKNKLFLSCFNERSNKSLILKREKFCRKNASLCISEPLTS